MGQERIQEETRELRILVRVGDAEQIFRSGADDQLVDQRVAFAVHLPVVALAVHRSVETADADATAFSRAVGSDDRVLVAGSVKFAVGREHA